MKKIIIMAIMLMAIVTAVSALEAPAIDMSFLNQDPDPVGPGDYVELRFKITNNQPNTNARDLQVRIDPRYPFYLDPSEEAVRDIGDLPATGDKNAVIVKYRVRVDDNAVEGDNSLVLEYKHSQTDWIGREFEVDVQTLDANLAIISVETIPEVIKPGEETTVRVKVKNLADSSLTDITMKLDLTYATLLSQVSSISATDSIAAIDSLPFAPLGSATEQKIFRMSAGEEREFVYNLIAYPDATSRVYKVPIQITYYDELETSYTKNDIIGLIVGTKPDMSVVIDETDIYAGKNSGTVTVRFINKGFSDVKFLDVMLQSSDDYDPISADEVYIGNVDSDDYETADFDIYLKRNGESEKEIPFKIKAEYRDANNNAYEDEYELMLKVLSPDKVGQSTGPNLLGPILVIGAIGAVLFWYFRRKKK